MDIFLKLLIAHLLTDFFLQPDKWVNQKKDQTLKSKYLYYHIIITGLMAWLFLFDWTLWYVALFVAVTHFVIDLIKITFCPDNLKSFVTDQICHIAILGIAALFVSGKLSTIFSELNYFAQTKWLTLMAGYLLVTTPMGFLVGKATQKWRDDLEDNQKERDSLKDAGIWIGILERILVVTFVLFNQFEAIGFLIAAKSILRFSDKSEDNPRKQTEYVLIGTLISFTLALFVGLLIKTIIDSV